MDDKHKGSPATDMTRRQFVRTAAAAAGAGLMMPSLASSYAATSSIDELAVAIIGPGSQGRNLLTKILKIPGIRFVAVCDVWPYHQKYAANILKKYDQIVNVYADYREMLAAEHYLDAVIIATPDWVHADQTVACLEAGIDVYCEKEMSNTLEGARRMVLAARRSGRLLQIGHQRRSNPRYAQAMRLIHSDKLLGRITHCNGQWNRAHMLERGWPKGKDLDAETLKRHGYESMDAFRNWRWYRRYSGGPMADLGSHQIDVFNWFLETEPRSVMASGGLDYYTAQKGRDWYDNVMSIYEYATPSGPVRAFYQVLNTTSHGGFYETFMGDQGSLVISEDPRKGFVFREAHAVRKEWEDEAATIETMDAEAMILKVGETLNPGGGTTEGERLDVQVNKPVHQLHLENFFDAMRYGSPLTCPPDVAYATAVSVLAANRAVDTGQKIRLSPDLFRV